MKLFRKVTAAVLAALMLVTALPAVFAADEAPAGSNLWTSAQQLDNYALTATAEADNYLGALGSLMFGASHINDGDLSTVWRSGKKGNGGEDAVFTLHWDEPQTIACMAVIWVGYYPDTLENGGYKIQVTDETGAWIDVGILNGTRTNLSGYVENLDPDQTAGVDMSLFSDVNMDLNLFGAQTTTDMRMVCMKAAPEVLARDEAGNPTEFGDKLLENPMLNEVYCFDNDIWTLAINYLLGRDEFEVNAEGELTAYYGIGRNVVIPETVTSIQKPVFDVSGYGSKITTVTIPATLTDISPAAFFGCNVNTEFIVAEENPNYCAVDGVLYNKDKTRLIAYAAGKPDTSFTVPGSVKEIGEYAFAYALNLEEVILPEGLEFIGDMAFTGAYWLTKADIPSTVTTLGAGSYSFTGLKEFTVPANVKRVGYGVFNLCTELKTVTMEEGITEIGSMAFAGCTSLDTVNLPASLTTVRNNAFAGCLLLASAEYPGSDEAWDTMDIGIGNSPLLVLTEGVLGEVDFSSMAYAYADSTHATNGGGTLTPDLTVDGDLTTRWQANSQGNAEDPSWLALEWAEEHTFTKLTVEWEVSRASLSGYVIQTSEDGETWTNVPMTNSRADLADSHYLDTVVLTEPVTTSYLRIYITACDGKANPSIYEVKCIGEGLTAEEPTDMGKGVSEGLEFTMDAEGYYYVTGIGTCTDSDIVIPARYNGTYVAGVDAGAFAGLANVTSITLTDGMTYIAAGAITDCPNLEKVYLPSSVMADDLFIQNCPNAVIFTESSEIIFNLYGIYLEVTEENPNPVSQLLANYDIQYYALPDVSAVVEVLIGDVNLSGAVEAGDLTVLARHVGGVEAVTDPQALAAADTDASGSADATDLTALARHVGGVELLD